MSEVIRWLPSHFRFGGATIRVAARIDEVELSRRHSHQHLEPVTREVLEALFVVPERRREPAEPMAARSAC